MRYRLAPALLRSASCRRGPGVARSTHRHTLTGLCCCVAVLHAPPVFKPFGPHSGRAAQGLPGACDVWPGLDRLRFVAPTLRAACPDHLHLAARRLSCLQRVRVQTAESAVWALRGVVAKMLAVVSCARGSVWPTADVCTRVTSWSSPFSARSPMRFVPFPLPRC